MATKKQYSYNEIIDIFSDISTRHNQINGFNFGWSTNLNKETNTYPFVQLVPDNSNISGDIQANKSGGEFISSFSMLVVDLLSESDDNLADVLSDTLEMGKDIVAEIKNGSTYRNEVKITGISFEPFEEKFNNQLAGWNISLEISFGYAANACITPINAS